MNPRLLLLPGLGCDSTIFEDLIDGLHDRLPVSVSDAHFRCDSLEAMAASLLAEFDGPLLLCGVSLGGMLALQMVALAPERIVGLALLGSSAEPDSAARRALRLEGIRRLRAGEFEALMQENLSYSFHPSRLGDATLTGRFLAMLARCGAQELVRQNELAMRRPDLLPTLAAVSCPTLVLCGDDDQVTPPAHSTALAAGIAGAAMELVADCGHMLTIEQPAAVRGLLRGWISRCVG